MARPSMKEALMARVKDQSKKNAGSVGFFKDNLEGVTFWSPKEGDHLFDIVPYKIGPNDPRLAEFNRGKGLSEDDYHYVLEIYAHFSVGAQEETFICMAETFGKKCPICDHRRQLTKEGADDDTIKSLRVSRYPRSIYNVIVYDSQEAEDKGNQIWHTSNYLMEQYLTKLAKGPTRPGRTSVEPFVAFADPDDGKSISFNQSGEKMSKKFLAHQFVDRDYSISDEQLDEAKCLDDIIHIPEYGEVYEAYWGEEYDGDEGSAPSGKPAASNRSSRGSRGNKKSTEDVPLTTEGASDDNKKESEEDAKKARLAARAEAKKKKEEEAKAKKKKEAEAKKKKDAKPKKEDKALAEDGEISSCPNGYVFGKDMDEKPECEDCQDDVWDACAKKAETL